MTNLHSGPQLINSASAKKLVNDNKDVIKQKEDNNQSPKQSNQSNSDT